MDALEALEHDGTIDEEVADDGEGACRRERDRLLKLVDERAAGLTRLAVDDHHAGAADLLQAVALPVDGCDRLAVDRHRVLLDLHQSRDDVEAGTIVDIEFLLVGAGVRAILALYDESYFLLFCHLLSPPLTLSSLPRSYAHAA